MHGKRKYLPGHHKEWSSQRRYRVGYRLLCELKERPCMDCGGTFPPECMDFDHRPGEMKMGCVKDFMFDEEVMMAEVAKCDLVCSNCHRIRTKARWDTGPRDDFTRRPSYGRGRKLGTWVWRGTRRRR